MPWIFKPDKDDFVGKWATEQVAERGLRWMLAGFESPTGKLPLEGGPDRRRRQVVGRVTSSRRSAELGKVIGLAIMPVELARDGGASTSSSTASPYRCASISAPSSIPRGQAESMSALEFLSVSAASDGAVAKSSMERAQREAGARFEERDGWLVPVAHPRRGGASGRGRHRRSLPPDQVRGPAGRRAAAGEASSITGSRPSGRSCSASRRRGSGSRAAHRTLVLDMTAALGVLAIVGPEAAR